MVPLDVYYAGSGRQAGDLQAGRYDDILVREDGHWKFKRRSASNDIPVMP